MLKYVIPIKNKEISAFVQKELFKMGYKWHSVKAGERNEIKHLAKKYLVICKLKKITHTDSFNATYDGTKYKKISIIDLWTNNLNFK